MSDIATSGRMRDTRTNLCIRGVTPHKNRRITTKNLDQSPERNLKTSIHYTSPVLLMETEYSPVDRIILQKMWIRKDLKENW